MKFALICLPYYRHTRRLLFEQLAASPHEYYLFETQPFGVDDAILTRIPNVHRVHLPELDAGALTRQIEALRVAHVTTFSDRGLLLAAELRQHFGMPGNDRETELGIVDKARTRAALCRAGLSRVAHQPTTLAALLGSGCDLPFPLIVKPTTHSGSLCVELIRSASQLSDYVERCNDNPIFKDGRVIAERYIPGLEYSVEGLIVGQRPHFFGICERLSSGPPHFIGTGHDFFARHENAPAIEKFITDVIGCLRLQNCPFHIEMKATEYGFEVIEAHSRYGGLLIMELVEQATGVQPFKAYLDLLATGAVELPSSGLPGVFAEHMFLTPPGVIRGLTVPAHRVKAERVMSAAVDYAVGDRVGNAALPLHHWGYVTFKARDRTEAQEFREQLAREVRLELEVEPSLAAAV